MSEKESSVPFVHSVPVPRLYKIAAKVARKAIDEASVKDLVYQESKYYSIKALHALVSQTLRRREQLDYLMNVSCILMKEPRLDPWLARILITELLWGKKCLPGESKPIQTILTYEETLNYILNCSHPFNISPGTVKKNRYIRVNPLKMSLRNAIRNFENEGWTKKTCSTDDCLNYLQQTTLEEGQFMQDLHVKELLIFPQSTRFFKHQAYLSGSIVPQNKASCLPVCLLNPPENSVVLDMCASNGIKACHIATVMNNKGTVYAVEKSKKRCGILRDAVKRLGADCVQIINKDVLEVTEKDCPGVEYILLDPGCTGRDIMDRDDKMKDSLRLSKLVNFQTLALRHAVTNFPQAKKIIYTTCSLNQQENECVVKEIIENSPSFKLHHLGALLGITELFDLLSVGYERIGEFCMYAKPHKGVTNGFFAAVFERLKPGEVNHFSIWTMPNPFKEGEDMNDMNVKSKYFHGADHMLEVIDVSPDKSTLTVRYPWKKQKLDYEPIFSTTHFDVYLS